MMMLLDGERRKEEILPYLYARAQMCVSRSICAFLSCAVSVFVVLAGGEGVLYL